MNLSPVDKFIKVCLVLTPRRSENDTATSVHVDRCYFREQRNTSGHVDMDTPEHTLVFLSLKRPWCNFKAGLQLLRASWLRKKLETPQWEGDNRLTVRPHTHSHSVYYKKIQCCEATPKKERVTKNRVALHPTSFPFTDTHFL